jgi:hypothetical protein
MNAQPKVVVDITKPKRKYTKRKPKLAAVKPSVKKELPKTARAYLRTLGIAADKEGTAIKELIKMHSELSKGEKRKDYELLAVMTAPASSEKPSLWQRWFGK